MEIPTIEIPPIDKIETISIPLPTADVPFYAPLVVPPSDLREPEGVEAEASEDVDTGIRNVNIPIIDFDVPLPENEILITASTTAVVSVAATLTATAAFKWVVTAMKPILKTAWKKISPSDQKSLLTKIKENVDDHDEQMQILGAMVRLGVVVWSGFIITLNYVELPMVRKPLGASSDITFVASIFTGALATFGLSTGNGNKKKRRT